MHMSRRTQLLATVFVLLLSPAAVAQNTVTVTDPSPTAYPTPTWTAGNGVSVTFSPELYFP